MNTFDFKKYFDIEKLQPEDRRQFVESIMNLALARIANKLADVLSDEQLAEMEQLQDSTGEKTLQWLSLNVPDFGGMMDSMLSEISQDLSGKMQAVVDYSLNKAI